MSTFSGEDQTTPKRESQMLTKQEIRDRAIKYLVSKGHPIVEDTCRIVMPHEETRQEYRDYVIDNNIAYVSFASNFDPDLPNQDLLPYAFIVFVNIETGEVSMVRHM